MLVNQTITPWSIRCITDSKVKLVIPSASDSTAAAVTQSAGELQTDERQFSPPVSKEEIASDDFLKIYFYQLP